LGGGEQRENKLFFTDLGRKKLGENETAYHNHLSVAQRIWTAAGNKVVCGHWTVESTLNMKSP